MQSIKSAKSVSAVHSIGSRFHRSSSQSSGTTSIDRVSILEARVGDFIRLFHFGEQSTWFTILNSMVLAIFLLQALSTVLPSNPATFGSQFFWENAMAIAMFPVTGWRTLMSHNIPISFQYWITSIFCVIQVSVLGLIIWTFRIYQQGNIKLASRLRRIVSLFTFLNFLFLLPLAHNNTGWVHCNYSLFSDRDEAAIVSRTMFDKTSLPCWEFTHSFTGFMAILSIVTVRFFHKQPRSIDPRSSTFLTSRTIDIRSSSFKCYSLSYGSSFPLTAIQ